MPTEDLNAPYGTPTDEDGANRRSRRSHRLSVTDLDVELLVIAVQAARTGYSSGHDLPGLHAGASIVRRWLKHHSEG